MATTTRTIRAVAPHVPKIKFPQRNTTDSTLQFSSPAITSQKQTTPSPSPVVTNKPAIGITPRGTGIEWSELPPKYQRKPMSEEEMEYINRGGPD